MQRYFSDLVKDNGFELSKDDEFHIIRVMRMQIGDLIEVVYKQKVYLCQIESLNPFKIIKKEVLVEQNENTIQVTLVQSLVNEQKMDFILQKGTELGINTFYGFKAKNSVIKENTKSDKKIMRWQKIVKEAAEQSKRNTVPMVQGIIDLETLCHLKADLKLILTVNEKSNTLKKVLQEHQNYATMIIVVGPEGGFDTKEEEKLEASGFIPVSLGLRVLRTETASLATMAMINYEWMV